jgi:tRNA(fMet)-specific endonuclease VapC
VIVAQAGYSRPKVLDRMIAARPSFISLVTMNAADYADIPKLSLVKWQGRADLRP